MKSIRHNPIPMKDLVAACERIHKKYYGKRYRLKGRNHDRRVKLKPVFSAIAWPFFYGEIIYKVRFYPWEVIVDLSKEIDRPVTDLISMKSNL